MVNVYRLGAVIVIVGGEAKSIQHIKDLVGLGNPGVIAVSEAAIWKYQYCRINIIAIGGSQNSRTEIGRDDLEIGGAYHRPEKRIGESANSLVDRYTTEIAAGDGAVIVISMRDAGQ